MAEGLVAGVSAWPAAPPAAPDGRDGRAWSDWLRHVPGDAATRARLLCFPHAGGGASAFNGWRRALPGWIELVKAQLPGREDRRASPPHTRIEELVRDLFPHVARLADRPLALYGHSMGALVAFELARELRRRGDRLPLAVFVSGRRAPQAPLRRPPLHALSEGALVEELRGLGGTLSLLLASARWRDHYLPTLRADLRLSDVYDYRDEPPLDCPLHAFLGETDRLMPRADWEAWSAQAAGEYRRYLLPGGHFFSRLGQATLVAKIVERVVR